MTDAEDALFQDAEGIGLFRSEFLYLEKNSLPTEKEQFESYRAVAEKMKGKKVIIRTMDIGADKQADYLGLEKEENPAMGYRAIRICLDQQEIFRNAAACDLPCKRIRDSRGHVSDDHFRGRSTGD